MRSINLLFLYGLRWKCLRCVKESIIAPIYKKGDKTNCSNYRGISLLSATYKILSNTLLSRLSPYAKEIIGDLQCGFRWNRSTAGHIILHSLNTWEEWEYIEGVHELFIDFKKDYDSVRMQVLYNILIEFGIPMKLISLIKMCLNETFSRVQVGKLLCDVFTIRNGLKWGIIYRHCFSTCCRLCH